MKRIDPEPTFAAVALIFISQVVLPLFGLAVCPHVSEPPSGLTREERALWYERQNMELDDQDPVERAGYQDF